MIIFKLDDLYFFLKLNQEYKKNIDENSLIKMLTIQKNFQKFNYCALRNDQVQANIVSIYNKMEDYLIGKSTYQKDTKGILNNNNNMFICLQHYIDANDSSNQLASKGFVGVKLQENEDNDFSYLIENNVINLEFCILIGKHTLFKSDKFSIGLFQSLDNPEMIYKGLVTSEVAENFIYSLLTGIQIELSKY